MTTDNGPASKVKDPVLSAIRWLKQRSPKEKIALSSCGALLLLLLLWRTIEDHDTLFVLAEASHFLGIGVLAYKILQKKSVAGLSLQSQFLTLIYLGARLFCSVLMEQDIHTLLDGLTFVATGAIITFMLSTDVRLTYQKAQDKIKFYYVVAPCMLLALVAHPATSHSWIMRFLWSFCVYLEALSVYPQLRMMQNAKVVERFTAHYVFALGLSRFLSCAHWLLQILEGNKYLLQALGSGVWPAMVLLSEIVQTGILADFCYYYIKSYAEGLGVLRLPTGVV